MLDNLSRYICNFSLNAGLLPYYLCHHLVSETWKKSWEYPLISSKSLRCCSFKLMLNSYKIVFRQNDGPYVLLYIHTSFQNLTSLLLAKLHSTNICLKEVLKLRTLQKLLLRKNYHTYKPKSLKLAKHENSQLSYFDFAFVGGWSLSNWRPPEVVTAATEATAEATAAAFFIFCFSLNLRIISPLKWEGGADGSFPALVLRLFGLGWCCEWGCCCCCCCWGWCCGLGKCCCNWCCCCCWTAAVK